MRAAARVVVVRWRMGKARVVVVVVRAVGTEVDWEAEAAAPVGWVRRWPKDLP